MKLLVLGIDGGTTDIFDAFDMPFWAELRRRSNNLAVTEDLNQRGWARMLSGQGADQTGGLYVRPKQSSPPQFELSFDFTTMKTAQGFKPIWEFAQDAGHSVGMMNVPTSHPAQEVNGFYVSGGGGGIFQGGLPANSAFPHSVSQSLAETEYIFDTRLGAESFPDPVSLVRHLNTMMSRRVAAFAKLSRDFQIQFGFLALRATTVLLYLSMSEIAYMMRFSKQDPQRKSWSSNWLDVVSGHMRTLDDCIARLFDALQPEHYILASDHSIVPWTHNIDLGGFLVAHGYANYSKSRFNWMRNVARAVLRPKFRQKLGVVPLGGVNKELRCSGALLNNDGRAFSGTYCYGIYINDQVRFGGPVRMEDVAGEVQQIISDFNWAAARLTFPLSAAPYRELFMGAPHSDKLPDITILQSGHAFPTFSMGAHWYAHNPNYGPVRTIRGVGGMHTGQKGRHPILMCDVALSQFIEEQDAIDLRLVHTLTKRLFEKRY